MKRFCIDDFPQHIQAQIRAQMEPTKKPAADIPADPIPSLSATGGRKITGPNKTETEYRQTYLRNRDARYEAITLRMANGHRYTPDWCVFDDESGLLIECHECKGAYALHSQQRARLAFDQAKVEFPGFKWVWAVKKSNGWEISHA